MACAIGLILLQKSTAQNIIRETFWSRQGIFQAARDATMIYAISYILCF